MKSNRPTRVSVVGWFFIIVSSLSILSAIGYIVVGITSQDSMFEVWPGYVQILVASLLVYCSIGFLNGASRMRSVLEYSSYFLILAILYQGITAAIEFNAVGPLLVYVVFLILMGLIVHALRSNQTKTYVS
tara:strand:+ start:425 stop:817 length:393 start_codon:yes stop_codon:yes gene_type:complete